MRRKVAAALLVAIAGVVTLIVRHLGPVEGGTLKEKAAACLVSTQEETVGCLTDISLAIYEESGPGTLFDAFRDTGSADDLIATTLRTHCHDILHDVGKNAAVRLGESAVVAGASICEGGYYHGVYLGSRALVDGGFASELCSKLADDDLLNCWHGYGHSQFDGQDDILQHLPDCSGAEAGQGICREGYYMEFALSNVPEIDDLQTCRELPEDFAATCTRQLGTLVAHRKEVLVANWCRELQDGRYPTQVQRACWYGLGAAVGWTRGSNPYNLRTWREDIPEHCASNPICLSQSLRSYGDRNARADFLEEAGSVLAEGGIIINN